MKITVNHMRLEAILEMERDGVKLNRHNRRKKAKLARVLRIQSSTVRQVENAPRLAVA